MKCLIIDTVLTFLLTDIKLLVKVLEFLQTCSWNAAKTHNNGGWPYGNMKPKTCNEFPFVGRGSMVCGWAEKAFFCEPIVLNFSILKIAGNRKGTKRKAYPHLNTSSDLEYSRSSAIPFGVSFLHRLYTKKNKLIQSK